MTFQEWMKEVDKEVSGICGMGVNDLPDCCFRDEYEAGTEPSEMARIVLENAWFEFY